MSMKDRKIFKDRKVQILFVIVGLIIISRVALSLVSYFTNQIESANDSQALMIITSSGGMCVEQCNHSRYRIYEDGTYEGNTKLTQKQIHQLKSAIDSADFSHYGSNPSPRCRSFADGSDTALIFPQKYGSRSFVICMMNIPDDDKVFNTIDSITGIDSRNKKSDI